MKILIREANWLGDAVMTIPALMAIHDHYPEAAMTVVAKESILPLFNLLPWEIEAIPLRTIKSWLRLREKKFDLAVIFPNSFRSALEVYFTGAPVRLGYGISGRSLFLTERVPLNKDKFHQADYYYHLLPPLAIKGKRPNPQLVVKEKDKELVSRWLKEKGLDIGRPLITISPGASYGEAKCWPEEKFALLARRLTDTGEVVMVGTDRDVALIDRIVSLSRVRAFNLAGETSITMLASLFSISKFLVSNDNGSMHLAAALGVRGIGLFGPTDPFRTGPLGDKITILRDKVDCSPCKKRTCHSKKCFEGITAERVYAAIKNTDIR